jgi:hypothetical protein
MIRVLHNGVGKRDFPQTMMSQGRASGHLQMLIQHHHRPVRYRLKARRGGAL